MSAPIDYSAHGFRNTGFGSTVRQTEICVVIVRRRNSPFLPVEFGVYLFHGAPGGAFWKNSPPLTSRKTIEEAREVAETLYGISGSGQFAMLVDD